MYSCKNWMDEWKGKVEVNIPDDITDYSVCGTRRPKILFRGKPIARDEVISLIAKEEPLFNGWNVKHEEGEYDSRLGRGVLRNIFYRQGFSWLSTFVLMDGYIGGSYLEWKYPNLDECIPKWVWFAKRNPNLDMVISYTDIDEAVCYGCQVIDEYSEDDNEDFTYEGSYAEHCSKGRIEKCREIRSKLKEYMFNVYDGSFDSMFGHAYSTLLNHDEWYHHIQFTIWIHEGKVDVLVDKAAVDKYLEYDKEYSHPYLKILDDSSVFDDRYTLIVDEKDMLDCFKAAGLTEENYEEALKLNLVKKPLSGATKVTREWAMAEMEKLYKKYDLRL